MKRGDADLKLLHMVRDGMSARQIATALGLNRDSVRGRISRARQRYGDNPPPVEANDDVVTIPRREYDALMLAAKPAPQTVDHDDTDKWDKQRNIFEATEGAVRIAVLSDIHLPDHDPAAVALALQIVKYVKPHMVVLNGDTLDMAAISRWGESRHAPKRDALSEIERLYNTLINAIAANTERGTPIVFLDGNHDGDRIARWNNEFWQFGDTVEARYAEIVRSGGRVWWLYFMKELEVARLLIQHGTRAGMYAARAALDDLGYGMAQVQGHVHRPGAFVKVTRVPGQARRVVQSITTGCLCNIPPQYITTTNTSAWAHGMAIATVHPIDGYVDLQNIVFHPHARGYSAVVGHAVFEQRTTSAQETAA